MRDFLFIHINRTGGVSIRSVIAPYQQGSFTHQTLDTYGKNHDISSLYRFAFVRNPWDRMVSIYHRRKREGILNTDFRNFVCSKGIQTRVPRRFTQINQLDWISLGGKLAVDFVGRFENLAEDWKRVACILGLPELLPHENASQHDHYRTYYDKETKEIVSQQFQCDIEYFGYRF